jgi:hypothetical protein
VPTAFALDLVGVSEFRGFRGDLREIALPSVLSILESERRTGTLCVESARGTSRIQLRKGRVLRARLIHAGQPCNAELLYLLIAESRGTFDFRPSRVGLGSEIQASTPQLLLEGLRRMNEKPSSAPSGVLHGFPARAAAAMVWVAVLAMFLIRSVIGFGQRSDLVRSGETPGSAAPNHSPATESP